MTPLTTQNDSSKENEGIVDFNRLNAISHYWPDLASSEFFAPYGENFVLERDFHQIALVILQKRYKYHLELQK